ncbi:Type I secretion system membrane fusion protein PrsE [Roseovarius litorisediminis]|uniref:Membrane fusion protein (MFP) family protein n=1 Tax=Roseovarius litorisediminis TaxID=1312363 RepID=A0A1Y5T839_9RHOB|nr:HlyD family type I secretion periplasmic adaptor subunit [Roseovarius litorisediminis]SLN55936.1 Type I secretion system membrane fusion protein PrsE [Roseovarius litorisediminis]
MSGQVDQTPKWEGKVPLTAGIIALVVLVGGLGLWSVVARISGAVVTSGMVEVESKRQVVQHPDGGVVGEVLVEESDTVEKGDVLIRLDGRQLQSELSIVDGQLREIAARKARLMAERDKAERVEFSENLLELAKVNPEVERMLIGEQALFSARREALQQEAGLLREQNKQIEKRIEGITAQLNAQKSQADLLGIELKDQKNLLQSQLTQASRVNELLREEANLLGQIGRFEAEMAELRGQAASNEIALLQLETRRREEAVTTLRDLQFREIELTERQIDLSGTLSRLDIRAPVSGLVYDQSVFAVQSVVRPAETLMYIIPQDQQLIVSARIETININDVFVGQEATLQFSAFDQRETPQLRGQVTRVSADVVRDEATGVPYYAAEITPYESEIPKLGKGKLLPGMPVEAFIQTGDRSALAYLAEPMLGFFGRAFRE